MLRIYITGCARSGTTLMQRLFTAFDGVHVVSGEHDIQAFRQAATDADVLVIKRAYNEALSNTSDTVYSGNELKMLAEKKPEIKILNMVRDGRDVIVGGYVSPKRWVHSIEHMIAPAWFKFVDKVVRYEDLVTKMDSIQAEIADYYKLKILHKWSEYPDFVPEKFFKTHDPTWNYKRRPVDAGQIGKNYDLYKQVCSEELLKRFDKCLEVLKYTQEDK